MPCLVGTSQITEVITMRDDNVVVNDIYYLIRFI